MRRHPSLLSRLLMALLLGLVLMAALWLGLVPQRYSPFPALDLDDSPGWFIDLKLAALRHDPLLCQGVLKGHQIQANPVPDSRIKNGCGWTNSVRVSTAGGAKVGVEPLTCDMAAALALWLAYEVQPAAAHLLGSRVASVQGTGTYSCRNIIGNPARSDARSEHAIANAFDIKGFTLEDGRSISVGKDWKGEGTEARFLKQIHARSCRYFRVSLGPDFNPAHADHFHLDRGYLSTCR